MVLLCLWIWWSNSGPSNKAPSDTITSSCCMCLITIWGARGRNGGTFNIYTSVLHLAFDFRLGGRKLGVSFRYTSVIHARHKYPGVCWELSVALAQNHIRNDSSLGLILTWSHSTWAKWKCLGVVQLHNGVYFLSMQGVRVPTFTFYQSSAFRIAFWLFLLSL